MFKINGLVTRTGFWYRPHRDLYRSWVNNPARNLWQWGPMTTPWDRPHPSGPYRSHHG